MYYESYMFIAYGGMICMQWNNFVCQTTQFSMKWQWISWECMQWNAMMQWTYVESSFAMTMTMKWLRLRREVQWSLQWSTWCNEMTMNHFIAIVAIISLQMIIGHSPAALHIWNQFLTLLSNTLNSNFSLAFDWPRMHSHITG